jgi:hypothetical protein
MRFIDLWRQLCDLAYSAVSQPWGGSLESAVGLLGRPVALTSSSLSQFASVRKRPKRNRADRRSSGMAANDFP